MKRGKTISFPIVWSERGVRISMSDYEAENKTLLHCIGWKILEISPMLTADRKEKVVELLSGKPCDINTAQKILEASLDN